MRGRGSIIDMQENVIDKLQSNEIYPFSVIFSYEAGDNNGILAITLYTELDYERLLDLLEYESQCDKTGFVVLKDTNTVILSDMALINFYVKL